MRRPATRNTVALALMAVLAIGAQARSIDHDEVLRLRRSGELLPLETVQQAALARYPGARVLEIELEEEHGRYVYEFELLVERRVRELEIDARTGAILHDELED
jgi:uncharacterized membrane protein YkoI